MKDYFGRGAFVMMTFKSARNSIRTVPWTRMLIDYLLITLAAIGEAVGVLVFFSSLNVAPSGVSGISVLLNKTLGTPIGLMILLMNIPIQILAYRMMPGGWRIVVRTIYALLVYTTAVDVLSRVDLVHLLFPSGSITDNALLGVIFGGITGGITAGVVIRAGGSFGGTSSLALILARRMGTPMSSTYLYTDTLVIGLSAFIFSWESALLAVVALFLSGMATDYILEGPSVIGQGQTAYGEGFKPVS
jgi:uncharacterized membrane-anchored protein YitT (DUF2179 family)